MGKIDWLLAGPLMEERRRSCCRAAPFLSLPEYVVERAKTAGLGTEGMINGLVELETFKGNEMKKRN